LEEEATKATYQALFVPFNAQLTKIYNTQHY